MTLPLPAVLDRLEISGHQFLATFQGISDADWRWKPRPDAWSMEEVAEHVAIIEAQVRKLILEYMTVAPATPELLAETRDKDARIEARLTDAARYEAPEPTRPRGRWATPAELGESFRSNRQRVLDFMRATPIDAEAHGWIHPAAGPLTLRQWLLFQALHVERHTRQMKALARKDG